MGGHLEKQGKAFQKSVEKELMYIYTEFYC